MPLITADIAFKCVFSVSMLGYINYITNKCYSVVNITSFSYLELS